MEEESFDDEDEFLSSQDSENEVSEEAKFEVRRPNVHDRFQRNANRHR